MHLSYGAHTNVSTDGSHADRAIFPKPIRSGDNKKKYKDFVFEIHSGNRKKNIATVVILAHLTWSMFLSNLVKIFKTVRELRLHKISTTGDITIKRKESCYSCSWHTYRLSSMSLPQIIKILQTKEKFWYPNDFGFEIHLEITRKWP